MHKNSIFITEGSDDYEWAIENDVAAYILYIQHGKIVEGYDGDRFTGGIPVYYKEILRKIAEQ